MHEHGPDELPGPVRGTSAWWRGLGAPPEQSDAGTPTDNTPPKKSRMPRKDGKPIRMDLVKRIRKEIADGTYDTDAKWDAALDRLLDRLERDY